MKRLLRISFNSAIFSLIPILSWFMLGLLVDKNLVNVFISTTIYMGIDEKYICNGSKYK